MPIPTSLAMGEVAGLAPGALILVALFDTAMSTFERIETATAYGKEYQQLAFQTSLLRLRLFRWAQGVDLLDPARSRFITPEDCDAVETLLSDIQYSIEDTEKYAQRYKVNDAAQPPTDDKELATVQALIDQISKMAIGHRKETSLTQKTRWALRDKVRFTGLIRTISDSITQLETLFPTDQERQNQLVTADSEQIIHTTEIEEVHNGGNDAEVTMKLLGEATSVVDVSLKEALREVLEKSTPSNHSRGHVFQVAVEATEHAEVELGDYVAPGAQVVGEGHFYSGTLKASDHAKVRCGDVYGREPWENVLDDL